MNAPSSMSCESCRDLLIELVCDELSTEAAAEVRAHALRCERCGPELEKLSATLRASQELPLLTPSPELEQRVMQAARDAMARRARGPARESSSPSSSSWTAWFTRLGTFAMSPQVAMASVLLLVVGIGLYALPLGHEAEPTALRAAEDEVANDNAPVAPSPAASATAVPAEPAARPAARELAAEGPSAELAKGGKAAHANGAAAANAQPERRLPAKAARARSTAVLDELEVQSEVKDKAPARAADDLGAVEGLAAAGGAAASGRAGSGGLAAAAKPRAETKSAQAVGALEKNGFAPPPPAPSSAPAPAMKAAAEPAPARAAAPGDAEESQKLKKEAPAGALSEGIAAIQRGDYARGEGLLLPLLQSSVARERDEARLWLARGLRARGDCARALTYYRPLTQAVTAARAILLEAADCSERTGNEAAAAKLRSRASVPAKP